MPVTDDGRMPCGRPISGLAVRIGSQNANLLVKGGQSATGILRKLLPPVHRYRVAERRRGSVTVITAMLPHKSHYSFVPIVVNGPIH